MSDITQQMNEDKAFAVEAVKEQGHDLGEWEMYSGDAVAIAVCKNCGRYVWVEIFRFSKDTHGPALTLKCEPPEEKKRKK